MSNAKSWILETRPQFLILSFILAFLGTALAWYKGDVTIWHALLAGIGLVLAHASVNVLNDYFDFRSGIDKATKRTPFSGGSGILPTQLLTPRQVLLLGITCFVLAVPVGIYFSIIKGWQLLPLLFLATFLIILYSPFILKRPWPEWAAGIGMGGLPILGMYFVQTGAYTWEAVIACIPSTLLVHNLLLLNEFPDIEADKIAKRRTLPIALGRKPSTIIYIIVNMAVYVWIIAWVAAGVMPIWSLLTLLSLPLCIKAINGAIHNEEPDKLIPGMAANVINILFLQLLLGIAYVIAHF
ncbi:MAG: prenyltransferase [Dehalococcoidales bacterium]|nr:prenyltransferase [Dehalococcoidales bacterium]